MWRPSGAQSGDSSAWRPHLKGARLRPTRHADRVEQPFADEDDGAPARSPRGIPVAQVAAPRHPHRRSLGPDPHPQDRRRRVERHRAAVRRPACRKGRGGGSREAAEAAAGCTHRVELAARRDLRAAGAREHDRPLPFENRRPGVGGARRTAHECSADNESEPDPPHVQSSPYSSEYADGGSSGMTIGFGGVPSSAATISSWPV
jgi:hypothetical protein